MASLSNQRHELFAQAIAGGKTGRVAYFEAGYECSDVAADAASSRLLKTVKVAARVAEIKGRGATGVSLTKSWVIEQTIELKRKAEESGAFGPAVKCMELLGREVNAFVEKKEIGLPGEFADLKDDELVDIVRRGIPGGLGAGGARGKRAGQAADKKTLQ